MSITELALETNLFTLEPFMLKLYDGANNDATTVIKHLIITGKNGSGKTILLREIADKLGVTCRISPNRLRLKFNSETPPTSIAFLEALARVVPDAGGDYMSTNAYQQWEALEAHNLVLALAFYLEGHSNNTEDREASKCLVTLKNRYKNLFERFWEGIREIFQLSDDEGVRFKTDEREKHFNYLEIYDKKTDLQIRSTKVDGLSSGHLTALRIFCRVLLATFTRHDQNLAVDLYHIFEVTELLKKLEQFSKLAQPMKFREFLEKDKARAESLSPESAIESANALPRTCIRACVHDCAQVSLRARARFSRRASVGEKNINAALEAIRILIRECNEATKLFQCISNQIDNYYYYYFDKSTVTSEIEDIINDLNEKIACFSQKFENRSQAVEKLFSPFEAQYRIDRKYVAEALPDSLFIPQIAIIDEPEMHLHVSLQKEILPMLSRIFPNTQFIVATHSPFIVSSLKNAVVYDLENKEKLEAPHLYSYDTLVEAFFDSSAYSKKIIDDFKVYKKLYLKNRSPEEDQEFIRVKTELELTPLASTEIYIAFHECEKRRREKSGKV